MKRCLTFSLFVVGALLLGTSVFAQSKAKAQNVPDIAYDSVASFFFEDFYKALKQGSPKLDAFRTAQTDTRQKFPAYRDWGAFQYSGRWR